MVRLWPFKESETKLKEQTAASIEGSGVECPHPIAYQIAVRDPSNPKAVTGVKCTQCGKTLDVVETES
jgi:hypothetical protein